MTIGTRTLIFGLGAVLLAAPLALADVVPQQKPANGCDAVWDLGDAAATAGVGNKPWTLDCPDGAACDADGTANGSCRISVNACVGSDAVTGCTANPLTKAVKIAKLRKIAGFVAPTATTGPNACGTAGAVTLSLKKGGRKPSKPFVLVMRSQSSAGKGLNRVRVRCVLPTGGSTTTTPGPSTCPARPAGTPQELVFSVPATGSDLDNGTTGDSHNFPVVFGSELHQCLSNCDGTTDSLCDMNGPVGEGTANGPTFGAPLPLLASNVAVCVVNRFRDPLVGTVDLATGEVLGADVPLFADVYVRLNDQANICPRCTNGRCAGNSKNDGAPCEVDGRVTVSGASNPSYELSTSCVPAGNPAGSLVITLPLTTQTVSTTGTRPCPEQRVDDNCGAAACVEQCSATPPPKGGIHQTCCANDPTRPCFPTKNNGTISRTGTRSILQPPWPDPTYPKSSQGSVLAGTFCIARTGDNTVDSTTGLPGPGAILLPATQTLIGGTQ